ncbi:MAG: TerB family tellurite resistance protein [Candidatus Omnitrophica bacterium]|nr:TerB family tellurite resistance protein [Candidatus Omnitrophota bacterium]
MSSIFKIFKEKVINDLDQKISVPGLKPEKIDETIAFGALLWLVADADNKFLPQEIREIEKIMEKFSGISKEQRPYLIAAIKKAAEASIDIYGFTKELSDKFDFKQKTIIVENLFRVACTDNFLDECELETIRKISSLFRLTHTDFINAKIKVKHEYNMPVAE